MNKLKKCSSAALEGDAKLPHPDVGPLFKFITPVIDGQANSQDDLLQLKELEVAGVEGFGADLYSSALKSARTEFMDAFLGQLLKVASLPSLRLTSGANSFFQVNNRSLATPATPATPSTPATTFSTKGDATGAAGGHLSSARTSFQHHVGRSTFRYPSSVRDAEITLDPLSTQPHAFVQCPHCRTR